MTETSLRSGVYDHAKIEARWQAHWDGETTFRTKDDLTLPKFYVLDMFPYPSGAGLHVGHPLSYTATDIVARYKRHQGFNVLHPMGWDAFGLPAEQYALKTGVHPAETTAKNIENFRRQLKGLGFSYDWSREVNTTDPDYYRWTQWIFLKLYERGLAYQAEVPVNWCPELGTVLANEEVVEGKSEVGGHPVVRRPMKQWMLKITAYADRLLEGLDDLDWPESIKTLQRNWIGKSTGAEVDFKVVTEGDLALRVFTTRPDTLFGATYMVIAPEHPDFDAIVMDGEREACEAYREAAVAKSDLERTDLAKEKTGVFTGRYAINPVNEEQIPIWLADYVMLGYGTGAIMAVPAHDERDFAFAKTFDLKIQEVVSGGEIEKEVWTGEGKLINSGMLDGLDVPEAKARIIAWLEEEKRGWPAVHTKLRDWLFSRQRYWGEPFPLLHHEDGSVSTVSEADLPVILPEVRRYEPSGTGESPLANETEWVEETHPESGEKVSRETHTMPQWAGSCWYYLRYIDPHNKEALIDPDLERYWMSVDLYVGGAEHAVLHLLYARFWHKVLYDVGVVSHDEPFAKLVSQGMILGEDGEKMSKSRGNVVNPDDVVGKYGADAFRLYEMFMGPLTATKPWQTSGMAGTHRFLSRVWRLFINQDGEVVVTDEPASDEVRRAFHGTLAKVTGDIESLSFNTAIASMMEFVNVVTKDRGSMPKDLVEEFLVMLEPFAPHIAEELNVGILEGEDSLAWASWPEVDEGLVTKETVVIPVQVNGKVRGTVEVSAETDEAKLEMMAREIPAVASRLKGATLKTVVVKPGQVVNFVIAP